MKTAAIPLAVAFGVASRVVFAESASDPMAQLRACSLMERAERVECLEQLSRNIAPPARPVPPGGDNWVVSDTTSPVDYMPIVTATTFSRGGSDGSPMRLSIHCRGGRTELVIAGPAVSRGSAEYAISYRINDDQPVQLAAGPPSFGTGAAFTGDVVRLLQVASGRGRHRHPSLHPNWCRPGGTFSARRTEDGAREASRGVQMATRDCQATQLMRHRQSWEMHDDEV